MTRVRYYSNPRSEMIGFLPDSYSHVLEVGCGDGEFSAQLRREAERWGIEVSPEAAHRAAARMDRVLTGSYETVEHDLPNGYFDLVICNDVLEHMLEPEVFLKAIQRKMTRNACLVGSVPNVRHVANLVELIWRGDWQYKEEGILDRTHVRFFTERSLERTLIENGLEIEILHGINSILSWAPAFRVIARNTFVLGLMTISMGRGSDIRFLQFGFRARTRS